MPNPKSGSVTSDVTKAIQEIKSGKVEFHVDKAGIVHGPLGNLSFATSALRENSESFMRAVLRAKPVAAKGKYVQQVSLCEWTRREPKSKKTDADDSRIKQLSDKFSSLNFK